MNFAENKLPEPAKVVISTEGRLTAHIYGFLGRRNLDVRVNTLSGKRAEVIATRLETTRESLLGVLSSTGYTIIEPEMDR